MIIDVQMIFARQFLFSASLYYSYFFAGFQQNLNGKGIREVSHLMKLIIHNLETTSFGKPYFQVLC